MTRRQFRRGWALQVITWLCFTAIPIVNASSLQTAEGWLRLCSGLGVSWVRTDTLETAENEPLEVNSTSQHCPCVNQALGLPDPCLVTFAPVAAVTHAIAQTQTPYFPPVYTYSSRDPPHVSL